MSTDLFDSMMGTILSTARVAPAQPALKVSAVPVAQRRAVVVHPEPVQVWDETPEDEVLESAATFGDEDSTPTPRASENAARRSHGRNHRVTPGGRQHTIRDSGRDRDIRNFLTLYRFAGVKHLVIALSGNHYTRTITKDGVEIVQDLKCNEAAVHTRLYAGRSAGYFERVLIGRGQEPVWMPTNAGIAASSFPSAPGIKVGGVSPVTLPHSLMMTGVAAAHFGKRLQRWGLTGEELLIPDYFIRRAAANAEEFPAWDSTLTGDDLLLEAERLAVPPVAGVTGFHVPDLACAREGMRPLAMEIEISQKTKADLTKTLTAYAHGQFDVVYMTHQPHIKRRIEEVWASVSAGSPATLTVVPLDSSLMNTAPTNRKKAGK